MCTHDRESNNNEIVCTHYRESNNNELVCTHDRESNNSGLVYTLDVQPKKAIKASQRAQMKEKVIMTILAHTDEGDSNSSELAHT